MVKQHAHTSNGMSWFADLGIIARIMLLALPPLIATLALSYVVITQQVSHTRDLDRVSRLSSLTTEIGALVHELQKERGASNIALTTKGTQFQPEMLAQRHLTTLRLSPVTQPQNTAFVGTASGLAAKLAAARLQLDRLGGIRQAIDAMTLQPRDSFSYYTTTIARLLDVVPEEGVFARDQVATRTFLALFGLMQAKEKAGQERAAGAEGFAAGVFSPAAYERFRHLKDEQDSFLQIFRAYASDEEGAILDAKLADPVNAEVDHLRRLALAGGLDGQLDHVSGATWFNTTTRRINLLRGIEVALADKLEAMARSGAEQAWTWLELTLAALWLVAASIAYFSFRTARGLARPIRHMTDAMVALAAGNNNVEIPYKEYRNEIGAMAAAVEVFRMNARVRREREVQIAHMARHDALTNLPNRTAFQEHMEEATARARRGESAAVFCIDLDDFKTVNDTLGHFAGDRLLQVVAERLHACIREVDGVARLGGDEFAIIQTGIQRPDDARILADRILQTVGEPFTVEGQRVKPNLSIGIAVAPLDGTDAEKLMKSADLALYRAKAEGGQTYCFFEASMEAGVQARRQLEMELREAIDRQAFEIHYQPLFDTQTGAILGFEALVRWNHPVHGLISPAEFIPITEETRLIIPLGEWIINRACADAMMWPNALSVAVNVSPIQFKDPGLVCIVVNALKQSGLAPSRLEIEITESVLLLEDTRTIEALHDLRALGVRIAMDDFGTGYSSLSYLRSFPFDKIKIDQSFIRGLGVTEDAEAIVRAITTLGRNLGMTVTAEGVETQAQFATLRAQGCSQLQGYLFSPPKPAREICAMIEDRENALLVLAD